MPRAREPRDRQEGEDRAGGQPVAPRGRRPRRSRYKWVGSTEIQKNALPSPAAAACNACLVRNSYLVRKL